MFDQIVQEADRLLSEGKLQDWILRAEDTQSQELFFVRDRLDMNRQANTMEYALTVYVDQEGMEDGKKVRYRGQATAEIGPDDSIEEVREKVSRAAQEAGYVQNPWFPLPKNERKECKDVYQDSVIGQFQDRYEAVLAAIFEERPGKARVNSLEIFAVDREIKLETSTGTCANYAMNHFTFELVTDAEGIHEPVEVFRDYTIQEADPDQVRAIVEAQLEETNGRAQAELAKAMDHVRVVIAGDEVEEFFQLYGFRASAAAVYNHISDESVGQPFAHSLLGEKKACEAISLMADPFLDHSPYSKPVDDEGTVLSAYSILENGVVKHLASSAQYSYYLGQENLGNCRTFRVAGGSVDLDQILKEDHLEIIKFSSFNAIPTTGDFGGEFRLGKLVVDGKVHYISGGSLSENLFAAADRIRFSKSVKERSRSKAPTAIIIEDAQIAGI